MDIKQFLTKVAYTVAVISLVLNVVLIYILSKDSYALSQHIIRTEILDFRNAFENKFLLSDKDIDFDSRLSLETAVRGLDDSIILSQWEKFVGSQTKEEATKEAKKLMSLLIEKTTR
jgi:hypothetical protein